MDRAAISERILKSNFGLEIAHSDENLNALTHYGILGMKWGVRRTQEQLGHTTKTEKNDRAHDGENTNNYQFRVRNEIENAKEVSSTKDDINNLSDQELRDAVARLQLEAQYRQLSSRPRSEVGNIAKNVVTSAATQIATTYIKTYAIKGLAVLTKNAIKAITKK